MNYIADHEKHAKNKKGMGLVGEKITPRYPELSQLCNQSQILSEPIHVTFPATIGKECEWEKGDNKKRGELGVKVAAFREQVLEIDVPEDRILCGLNMTSSKTIHRYNDALIFTIQDRPFASHSINSPDNMYFLRSWNSAQKIDRQKVIGLTHKYGSYCPPNVECHLERSLGSGRSKIILNSDFLRYIPKEELTGNIQFGLLVTGNRSIVDCQHSGVEMVLRYSYTKELAPVAH